MGVHQQIGIRSDHPRKDGSRASSMARLIALLETPPSSPASPTDASRSLKGTEGASIARSTASITRARKVIFFSASNGRARLSKSSGTSMVVLICICIQLNMLWCNAKISCRIDKSHYHRVWLADLHPWIFDRVAPKLSGAGVFSPRRGGLHRAARLRAKTPRVLRRTKVAAHRRTRSGAQRHAASIVSAGVEQGFLLRPARSPTCTRLKKRRSRLHVLPS